MQIYLAPQNCKPTKGEGGKFYYTCFTSPEVWFKHLPSKYEALSSNSSTAKKKKKTSQVPLAHTCNPNYSEDRDQKDCSSKPARANSSRDSTLKKTHHKKGLVEWLKW
jgi:hypothetical protein